MLLPQLRDGEQRVVEVGDAPHVGDREARAASVAQSNGHGEVADARALGRRAAR